jgi:membrane-associated phospholipid phosphatase
MIAANPVIASTPALPLARGRLALAWAAQYALWLAGYLAVNAVTAGRAAMRPMLPLEERIPFVPAAYPIYASIYLEVALPIWLARTRREYVTLQVACALGALVAFALFLAAPMPYPRPALAPRTGAEALLAFEWALDQPRCTFPSQHVTFAWLLAAGLGGRSRASRIGWTLNAIAISVATLLVKQHFVVDVLGGAALAWAAWRVAPAIAARLFGGDDT